MQKHIPFPVTDPIFNIYHYNTNRDTGELPAHTKSIFNKLGMLALQNLIAKSTLCLMQKARFGFVSSSAENYEPF